MDGSASSHVRVMDNGTIKEISDLVKEICL